MYNSKPTELYLAYLCPCAAVERLPRLVRRKVAMLCAFTVGFEKVLKSCLLLIVSLPGCNWNSFAQLLA